MIDETKLAKYTLGTLIAASVFCAGVAAYRTVVPPLPAPPPAQEAPAPHQK